MVQLKFKVGDEVIWTAGNKIDKFRGTVKKLHKSKWPGDLIRYEIDFGQDFRTKYNLTSNIYEFSLSLILAPPRKPKHELVEERCRHLWNVSRFVEKNPHLAY